MSTYLQQNTDNQQFLLIHIVGRVYPAIETNKHTSFWQWLHFLILTGNLKEQDNETYVASYIL